MEGLGEMEEGWRKGPWTAEEDRLLIEYVNLHGGGRWNSVSTLTGALCIPPLETKEEMATVNPSIVPNDQGLFYSVMCSNTSTPDAAHEDDFLWDGLWNLDDHVPGNLGAICATSRASMHNFGAPFY
ncbi:hypothetical protein Nepgr_010115 [Nepenthes gracilis]|uniref:Uncharacterized protein n=1 Tax=Nepenthes gracilis TaxID=150966 RepID=A0AAD3SCJ7_NEPGR|nr:hypothetical protein Nepgr_010115 [Nepenthes gracilis]